MSERGGLEGRTALVTGASRGIGRSIAEALSEAGARVWCLARSEEPLVRLARELGGEALVADLTDDVAVWGAVDDLRERLGGPPDLVVNAAGVFGLAPAASESLEELDRHLDVNLRGTFLVVRALLPAMLERRGGLIVNLGSVAGRRAFPGNAAYAASKFAVRGYHEVLLEELRGSGVRATLIEPAATDTAMWDAVDPDADPSLPDREMMLSGRDVAEAVLFVATRPERVRIPLLQIERA
jgi:NADP-dependent 3-hydroxy acid dehydrogenase YdfG